MAETLYYPCAPKRTQRGFRLRFVPSRAGGGDSGGPGGAGHVGGDADGRREEPVLPDPGSHAGEPDGDRLAPDLVDEGPGRFASPELRRRRGGSALRALAGGEVGGRAQGADGGDPDALRRP